MIFERSTDLISLELRIERLGDDYSVTISGGDQAHIGSVVLALPRPSLDDPAQTSCTSSVINRLSHKDEDVCRLIAETLCKHYQSAVACAGGIHVNNISEAQIKQVFALVEDMLEEIMEKIV